MSFEFFDRLLEGLRAHLSWLVVISAATFIGTLLVVPWIVVRLPADYFDVRHPRRSSTGQSPWRWLRTLALNVLGLILVVMGLAMLVLPGQGLVTVAIGVMLMSFPGKYRLERWLVRRRPVYRSINWLRRRADRPPLQLDGMQEDPSAAA